MALAAIADAHAMARLPNPCVDALGSIRLTMQGIKKEFGKESTQAEGLTKGLLKGIINVAIGSDLDGVKAAPLQLWREAWRELVCFMGVARFSDLNRVRRKDVTLDGNLVQIKFNTRKNDQYHKTHTAFLMRTGGRYCPYKITQMYLSLLPLDPDTYMLPDCSVKFKYLRPASYSACRRIQKSLLRQLDYDPAPYGLHSARVGGMKYLEDGKLSDADMNFVGGWVEGSSMASHYAKTAMAKYLGAARKLSLITIKS
jgi:hypothetical protein